MSFWVTRYRKLSGSNFHNINLRAAQSMNIKDRRPWARPVKT